MMQGFRVDSHRGVRWTAELFDTKSEVHNFALAALGHDHADEIGVIRKMVANTRAQAPILLLLLCLCLRIVG